MDWQAEERLREIEILLQRQACERSDELAVLRMILSALQQLVSLQTPRYPRTSAGSITVI